MGRVDSREKGKRRGSSLWCLALVNVTLTDLLVVLVRAGGFPTPTREDPPVSSPALRRAVTSWSWSDARSRKSATGGWIRPRRRVRESQKGGSPVGGLGPLLTRHSFSSLR